MDVAEVLGKINHAWLYGTAAEVAGLIRPHFDDDIVMCGPGFREIGRGGDLCAQSYARFLEAAVVDESTLEKPVINVIGETAIATYGWSMTYTIKGTQYRETGHDVFLFLRRPDGWKAVWRAMLAGPAAEA